MMVVALTIETAGIAIDQAFGHMHDPAQSLGAVPIMLVLTAIGLSFSVLFLRGVRRSPVPSVAHASVAVQRRGAHRTQRQAST